MHDSDNGTPQPDASLPADPPDATVPTRLLVVDDERVVCDALARHLHAQGYDVTVAYGGAQAVELIEKMTFDLALIDIRMPRVTGFDVLDALKRSAPGALAVMMTSYADIKSAVDLISRGAVDILSKPVDIDEVILTVQRLCGPAHQN